MKTFFTKQNIPLFFLVFISIFWSYYYKHNIWFNDYGQSKSELWLMIDIFITTPLVCFYCLGKNRKEALIKSLAYMGLLILLGSFIIPTEEKYLWSQLDNIRYIGIIAVVLFEFFIISTVIIAIRFAFKQNGDPDLAICEPLEKIIGKSFFTKLMQFDIRLWSFVLFPSKIKADNYQGKKHFYGHLKDGAQSFLQGFVFLIVFEIPLVHVLLHFIWSPTAANIITLLTVFSLAYFIAQYRALAKRPISLDEDNLIIRYGLSNPLKIKIEDIISVRLNTKPVSRNSNLKRFNLVGIPNIEIEVKNHTYKNVYLGVNSPNEFIDFWQSI